MAFPKKSEVVSGTANSRLPRVPPKSGDERATSHITAEPEIALMEFGLVPNTSETSTLTSNSSPVPDSLLPEHPKSDAGGTSPLSRVMCGLGCSVPARPPAPQNETRTFAGSTSHSQGGSSAVSINEMQLLGETPPHTHPHPYHTAVGTRRCGDGRQPRRLKRRCRITSCGVTFVSVASQAPSLRLIKDD